MMNSADRVTSELRLSRAELAGIFGHRLEFNVPMAQFTSFRTGGPAALFLRAESGEQAADAVLQATRLGLPFFLLGGGSNLLVSDHGFDGLVVKMDVRGMTVADETIIDCGAGEDLMGLVRFAADHGLTGLEFAAGIWGTVGGAIYGNAGAFGGEIGEVVRNLTLIDRDGKIRTVDREYCRFGYRDSYLKVTHEIVTRVRLQLTPGKREDIHAKIEEILNLRVAKHPDQLTAGCFFKNIPDPKEPFGKLPAGRLLEQIGAKDLQVGGAKVFERHANIIINTGSASAADICALAALMKRKVKERFGIELQEEVIKLGEFEPVE